MSNELDYIKTSASVPGMPAGTTPSAPVAPGNPSGEVPRLPADKDAAAELVIRAGGNKGGRPRLDGLVPGSPEAIAKDKADDAERKRKSRALAAKIKQQSQPAAPLPPAAPVASSGATVGTTPPTAPSLDSALAVTVGPWVAADFNGVAYDGLSFAESLRIKNRTKKAIDGHLPPAVAEQIGASFAFPVEAKTSLSRSSPEGLAQLFNWLRIPISLKPAVTGCPALIYIIVRDHQMDEKLDKMIAEEAERRKKSAESKT